MTTSPANRGCTGVTTQPVRPVNASADAAMRMPPEIRRQLELEAVRALFMCMPLDVDLVGADGSAEKNTLSIGGAVRCRMTGLMALCVDCNV